MDGVVNGPPARRRYDASGRRARSAESRAGVLAAARHRFLTDGYGATTVTAVAADAHVSPESVYKWFGSKAGLLRAVWERALAGSAPTHAERRSDAGSRAAVDGAAIIRSWARLTAEVGALADPIHRLVQAAAYVDPEVARLHAEIEGERSLRMEHNVDYLAAGGHLRADVTRDQARDVLLLYTTLYDRLVHEAGWTPSQLSAFVERGLTAHLLS
ncbi:MAG: TetR/AcrR family transcriptional regulator [Lapillicoccus sp.]